MVPAFIPGMTTMAITCNANTSGGEMALVSLTLRHTSAQWPDLPAACKYAKTHTHRKQTVREKETKRKRSFNAGSERKTA